LLASVPEASGGEVAEAIVPYVVVLDAREVFPLEAELVADDENRDLGIWSRVVPGMVNSPVTRYGS
jgi:hypothetical protein